MIEGMHDPVAEAAAVRLAETEAILADLAASIARIERERRKIRSSDWATLFRQMQRLFTDLATHPFLAGDAHAEMLLARMAASADLEEFDQRTDMLGEYVAGKLAYNAALRAARDGREAEPADLAPRRFGASAPGVGRLESQAGPSGSDFDISGLAGDARPRRGILRL